MKTIYWWLLAIALGAAGFFVGRLPMSNPAAQEAENFSTWIHSCLEKNGEVVGANGDVYCIPPPGSSDEPSKTEEPKHKASI